MKIADFGLFEESQKIEPVLERFKQIWAEKLKKGGKNGPSKNALLDSIVAAEKGSYWSLIFQNLVITLMN